MYTNPAQIAHGPMFIGIVFNILLYGIMIGQTYLYYMTYKEDALWIKALVGFLMICDTLNSGFDIAFIYNSLVNHYNDPMYLTKADWIFATDPVMTAIIACAVQLFFAWRVKVITSNIIGTVLIVICAVANLFAGLATSIAVGVIPEFVQFQKFQSVVILWLASSSLSDVLITFLLVTNLRGRKTGFQITDSVVNRIIRLTVQTGMLTSIVALIDLGLFVGDPSGLHLIFNMPLSKLYTNSLMSSLNSRGGWKFQASEPPSSGMKSTEDMPQPRRDAVQLGTRNQPAEVRVQVETHELVDRSPDQKEVDTIFIPQNYNMDRKEAESTMESVASLSMRRSDDIV